MKANKTTDTINYLAVQYMKQSQGKVNFDNAKKRVIKALTKGK